MNTCSFHWNLKILKWELHNTAFRIDLDKGLKLMKRRDSKWSILITVLIHVVQYLESLKSKDRIPTDLISIGGLDWSPQCKCVNIWFGHQKWGYNVTPIESCIMYWPISSHLIHPCKKLDSFLIQYMFSRA